MPWRLDGACGPIVGICHPFLHGQWCPNERKGIECDFLHPLLGGRSRGNRIAFGTETYVGWTLEDFPDFLLCPDCWNKRDGQACAPPQRCFYRHYDGSSLGDRLLAYVHEKRRRLALDDAESPSSPEVLALEKAALVEERRQAALSHMLKTPKIASRIAFFLFLPGASQTTRRGPQFRFDVRGVGTWNGLSVCLVSKEWLEVFGEHRFALVMQRSRDDLDLLIDHMPTGARLCAAPLVQCIATTKVLNLGALRDALRRLPSSSSLRLLDIHIGGRLGRLDRHYLDTFAVALAGLRRLHSARLRFWVRDLHAKEDGYRMTEAILSVASRLPSLKHLHLEEPALAQGAIDIEAILAESRAFPSLRALHVWRPHGDPAPLIALCHETLELLNLRASSEASTTVFTTRPLSELRHLVLRECPALHRKTIDSLYRNGALPSLISLDGLD